MRPHLFKGIDVMSLNKWYEGNLRIKESFDSGYRYQSAFIEIGISTRTGETKYKSIEVYPETVCEFTGLLDNNGRKIWEYDVVYFMRNNILLKGVVEWKKGRYVVRTSNESGELEFIELRKVLDYIIRESTSIIR